MAKKGSRPPGARAKLREFFDANVGRVVTSEELSAVAGISEWARRLRELRDEEGMEILSHNDREDLKQNQYIMPTSKRRPTIARGISPTIRRAILERNGFTCQACGAAAGEESGCEPGKKCRLQIDHVVPISQGGTDDDSNLRAVCVGFNKDRSNVSLPASRDAIKVLTAVRRQPRGVQREVYVFLRRKFGDAPGQEER